MKLSPQKKSITKNIVMSDNLKKGPQDSSRISLSESWNQ